MEIRIVVTNKHYVALDSITLLVLDSCLLFFKDSFPKVNTPPLRFVADNDIGLGRLAADATVYAGDAGIEMGVMAGMAVAYGDIEEIGVVDLTDTA